MSVSWEGSRIMRKSFLDFSLGWFLFGLGSQLQLVASLSFTELFTFVAAPFLIVSEWRYLRRNGMTVLFWLSIGVAVGCAVACKMNNSSFTQTLRGMAVTCLLPCTVVVCQWMLRKNMNGFKWWLVGVAISNILCTFVFRRSVELNMHAGGIVDSNTTQLIMSGSIYWIGRLGSFLFAPAQGWYLQCPLIYSMGAPLFLAGFSMLTSASGRSAALGSIATALILIVGGKRQRTMKRIGKYFFLFVVLAIFGAYLAKGVYRHAAINNWLGEEARQKYEKQTKGRTGMMALLMGGRMESFCGLVACVDKPIVGFGPWPVDYGGYTGEFLSKYADAEDAQRYYDSLARNPDGAPRQAWLNL